MIDGILSCVAPHLCCGCGEIGTLLCDNCKYNIITEPRNGCLVCNRPCDPNGVCNTCRVPYQRAWCVGERRDVLQRLIGLYKFERTKVAYRILGELLLDVLPELPTNTIIVPVPTVSGHVRERGYDHTLLLAKYIATNRKLECSLLLRRTTKTTQRHTSASARNRQAQAAFVVSGPVVNDAPYVLIDDIVTTGATVKYAASALAAAGASQVWVAVLAKQVLD